MPSWLHALKRLIRPERLPVEFVRKGAGWLAGNLPAPFVEEPRLAAQPRIEHRARMTQALGPRPLWSGYQRVRNYPRTTTASTRESDEVRTRPAVGAVFAWLAQLRRPRLIVEFGTAFGVSGMYWLAGLELAGEGTLLTFEPNGVWAEIARANLAAIGTRFELVVGTFEDQIATSLKAGEQIGIAFVDAIHTSDFVLSQYAVLLPLMSPGGLVLFDDIDFSPDMAACWSALASRREVTASATIDGRVGIIEL